MPEINKNYNEQEYIILCANGQKEYCEKRRATEKEEEVGGRPSALFQPSDTPLILGKCTPAPLVEGPGVIIGYYEQVSPGSIIIYADAVSPTPIIKFEGFPDMVAFRINNTCAMYNYDERFGGYTLET